MPRLTKFTRMILNARKADADSVRELKDYIYEQSGVANKALRRLEQTGMTEYAYGRAMEFLNTEYQSIKFPQAVAKRPLEDLITQAYELEHFLSSPTHTVRGAKKARRNQIEGIKQLIAIGYNVPQDTESWARITRIMGNDGLKLVGDVKYEMVEAIYEAFERGISDQEAQIILDRYRSGELHYNKLIQVLSKGE